FFFFRAEDGIRALIVTGVQTCALPIYDINPGDAVLLVIEDDPHYARILLGLARDKGFKGIVANKGAQGLAMARQYHPAAISLDKIGRASCRERADVSVLGCAVQ